MAKFERDRHTGSGPVPVLPTPGFGITPPIFVSRIALENPSHSASYTGTNKFLNPEFPNKFFIHSESTVANPFTHN